MPKRKHVRVTSSTTGPSLTQQSKGPDSDINNIVRKHMRTALPGTPIGNPSATRKPRFMDISSVDYQMMLNRVTDTQQKFASLPSRLRSRFRNDPHQLLRFVDNPENRAEALRLGLVIPTEEEFDRQMDLVDEASRAGEAPRSAAKGGEPSGAMPDEKGSEEPPTPPSKGGKKA